jgi:hypothetical protein
LPNYDARIGLQPWSKGDAKAEADAARLRQERKAALAPARAAKGKPSGKEAPDPGKIEQMFGEGTSVSLSAAGFPTEIFNYSRPLAMPAPNVAPEEVARQFLQSYPGAFQLSPDQVKSLRLVRTLDAPSGSSQVNLLQTLGGLPVFGAYLKVITTKEHAVVSVSGMAYPGLKSGGSVALSATDAVERAAGYVGGWASNGAPKPARNAWSERTDLDNWDAATAKTSVAAKPEVLKAESAPERTTLISQGPFQQDITARLVVFPLNGTQGRLAWSFALRKSMTEWYQMVVDAENGSLLNRTNLVQFANQQISASSKNPDATAFAAKTLIGTSPATVGSFAFDTDSGLAGNNVFMMIGSNEKPGSTHDHTWGFANSYNTSGGVLSTINLGTDRKLTFTPNASGGYNMAKGALTAGLPLGTDLGLGDDDFVCGVPPVAGFQYFGQTVTNVCVNSNGNITFENGDFNFIADPLDLPTRGRIMPLWTDLNPSAGGTVNVDFVAGTRLCFNWSAVPEFGAGGSNTFSACLFANNSIWLQYPTGGLTATSAFAGIRPPNKPGTIVPGGSSSWSNLDSNLNTRGKTGIVRYFPDMGTDERALADNLFWQFNANGHDRQWFNGFVDDAGNFQLTGLGLGGDPVMLTGVPAGLGLNNAFFGTPPDGECCGFSGFFLFTDPPFRNVHSGFDSDVTLHEYGHGVTNRLVGGAANPVALIAQQSGAMGEGWSDYFALSYNGDDVVGEYSTGNAATGIREVAYTAGNGRDLGQFGNLVWFGFTSSAGDPLYFPEVHGDGEIWASLLADVRRALMVPAPGPGLTNSQVEKLVVEALFYTPSNASMVQAANALISADVSLYGGTHACALLSALKVRGFGKHAANNDVDPYFLFPGQSFSVFASHDRPAGCGGGYSRGAAIRTAQFDTALVGATTANGWTGDGLWHVSARRSTTGTQSFYYGQEATGNYDTGFATFGSLTSNPSLNLSAATNPVLEFDVFLDNSADFFPFDVVYVQLSSDNGATWPVQRSIIAYPTFDFFYGAFTFQRFRIDLTPLKGSSTAKVRLYFDTLDPFANFSEGVYVDNVQVRDYTEF